MVINFELIRIWIRCSAGDVAFYDRLVKEKTFERFGYQLVGYGPDVSRAQSKETSRDAF